MGDCCGEVLFWCELAPACFFELEEALEAAADAAAVLADN